MNDSIIAALLGLAMFIGIILAAFSIGAFGFGLLTGVQACITTLAGVTIIAAILEAV